MKWLILAVVAVVALTDCSKTSQPPVVGAAGLADSAEQIMFDVHMVMTDRGVKRGDLFSDTVYVFNDETRFVLRRVRSTFNTETGAPNGTMRGDRGRYDLRQQVLEGWGNVVVTSTDGRRLESNYLKYSQAGNTVSTDSAYTLIRGNDVSRGIGFTSDPNLKNFRCFRACSGSALVQLQNLTSH